MLFGKILCERPGQDLLSEYNILACLEKSCNDSVIKSSYFSDKIRKVVYGAVRNLYICLIIYVIILMTIVIHDKSQRSAVT